MRIYTIINVKIFIFINFTGISLNYEGNYNDAIEMFESAL